MSSADTVSMRAVGGPPGGPACRTSTEAARASRRTRAGSDAAAMSAASLPAFLGAMNSIVMLNNTQRTAWLVGLAGALVLGMPAVGSGQGTVADDRAALEALYDATNGANWSRNDNWKTDAPLGLWYGVVTNDDGRVKSLFLSGNRLSGMIPVELGNLTRLINLNLSGNRLSGMIPVELGNLTSLINLILNLNQLSGTIPVELGNLTRVESLFLDFNQLSGTIPVELGNLTSLINLILEFNQLSGTIPVELGNLTRLEST